MYELIRVSELCYYIQCPAKIGVVRTDENIRGLARYNMDKVHEIADDILNICREPVSFERILQELFDRYGLSMNFEQYALVGSTVRSYLSWLKDGGGLRAFFENNALLWEKA